MQPSTAAGAIVRQLARQILERFGDVLMIGPADCPTNALDNQTMISGIAEDPLIVARCCVEDTPLALGAHPCPRLTFAVLFTHHQNVPVAREPMMLVSFVPGLKFLHTFHGRMLSIYDARAKHAGFMALELSADKRDVFWRIQETIRGAMQGDQPFAVLDERQERCFL